MRIKKQIEASRLNGAKSRGPVTPEGKAASSQNAVKHGILAENILTKGENESEFLDLCTQLHDEFQPATPFEESLVHTMAVASWRRERIWNVERVSLDLEMAKETQHVRHDELTAIAFSKLANESRTLDLIHRYETRYERQYLRAHKRLLEVQAARPKNEDPNQAPPLTPGPNVIPIDSIAVDPMPVCEDPSPGGADGLAVCVKSISAKGTQAPSDAPDAASTPKMPIEPDNALKTNDRHRDDNPQRPTPSARHLSVMVHALPTAPEVCPPARRVQAFGGSRL
jgi:hypothetical protein